VDFFHLIGPIDVPPSPADRPPGTKGPHVPGRGALSLARQGRHAAARRDLQIEVVASVLIRELFESASFGLGGPSRV
jgi:hypothetical protein